MKRKLVLTGLALAIGATLLLPGCCKKKSKTFSSKRGPVGTAPVTARGSTDQADKLDAIIKCYNGALRIGRMASYYNRRLRGRSPSRYRVPYVTFKPSQSVATRCNAAVGMKTPPLAELDPIMSEYAPLVETMVKEINVMDQYYRSKEYKTDKFARGKELDKSFKEHLKKFKALHSRLGKAIDVLADERDEAKIKRLAMNKNLRYFTAVFSRDAKLLSRVLLDVQFNQQAFATRVDAVSASYKVFADYANEHPEQASKVFWFSSFKRYADSFIGSVRSASKTKPTRRQRGQINEQYNDLVESSNHLRWRL